MFPSYFTPGSQAIGIGFDKMDSAHDYLIRYGLCRLYQRSALPNEDAK